MSKIYDYSNINNAFAYGDIHGEFSSFFHDVKSKLKIKSTKQVKDDIDELKEIIKKKRESRKKDNVMKDGAFDNTYATFRNVFMNTTLKKTSSFLEGLFNDTVIFVCGDCGIGFNRYQYYIDEFTKFNDLLNKNNCHLLFIRGNHDDPKYFNDEMINMSNIKTIPDYSIVKIHDYNILCIGGALSIDRTWRIKQESIINRFTKSHYKRIYWEDEMPIFDADKLDEIIKIDNINIDVVLSHNCPSIVSKHHTKDYDAWLEYDTNLLDDLKHENNVFDNIFKYLTDNGQNPKVWMYGHYHTKALHFIENTVFNSLPCNFSANNIISAIEYHGQKLENEKNEKKRARKIKVDKSFYEYIFHSNNSQQENDEARQIINFDDMHFDTSE